MLICSRKKKNCKNASRWKFQICAIFIRNNEKQKLDSICYLTTMLQLATCIQQISLQTADRRERKKTDRKCVWVAKKSASRCRGEKKLSEKKSEIVFNFYFICCLFEQQQQKNEKTLNEMQFGVGLVSHISRLSHSSSLLQQHVECRHTI